MGKLTRTKNITRVATYLISLEALARAWRLLFCVGNRRLSKCNLSTTYGKISYSGVWFRIEIILCHVESNMKLERRAGANECCWGTRMQKTWNVCSSQCTWFSVWLLVQTCTSTRYIIPVVHFSRRIHWSKSHNKCMSTQHDPTIVIYHEALAVIAVNIRTLIGYL